MKNCSVFRAFLHVCRCILVITNKCKATHNTPLDCHVAFAPRNDKVGLNLPNMEEAYGETSVKESLCCKTNIFDRRKTTPRELNREPLELKNKAAFSLVEMLMALLVASLLLAALAPVMTRKFMENVNVSGISGGNKGSITPCIPDASGECSAPMDAVSVSAIILSAGGGGGAAVAERVSSNFTTLGSITGNDNQNANTYKTNTYTITESMRDLEITLISGGAGGGGGNGRAVSFTKQADCEPFGVYISKERNGGKPICVSKYNPGENRDGSPALTGITSVPANGSTSCASNTTKCCWYGNNAGGYKTADICDTNANGIGYSGCYRTVCNWSAADTICKNWKPISQDTSIAGRLPTYNELTAWKNTGLVSDKNGKPGTMNWDSSVGAGLQLCNNTNIDQYTYTASTGAPRCGYSTGKCKGSDVGASVPNNCHSQYIWASTPDGSSYRVISLNSGVFDIRSYVPTFAFSVRCVIDESIAPYTGAGGGAGIYIKAKIPNEVLERATKNTGKGTLTVQVGNGGKGGGAKSTSRGANGSVSSVKITDSNNATIWYLEIPGGTGGAGASTTAGGASGAAGNVAGCKYMDITNSSYVTQKTLSCSNIPVVTNVSQGEAGGKGDASTSYASVGYGGRPKVENTLQGSRPQVPNGESATAINGGNAGSNGGGGAGGNCFNNNGTLTCGNGGYGKGGKAEIKYKKYTPGAAGGGGSAGTLLYIKNIPVRAGDVIKVSAGKGGNGGTSLGVNGSNGGNSFVTIAGTKFEVLGGGGGKAATAGNPDSNTVAIAGTAGAVSNLTNATKSIISGLNQSSYSILPENPDDTKGKDAPSVVITNNRLWTKSAGGDGGINTSLNNGPIYPCGGLSVTENTCFKDTIAPDVLNTNLGYPPPNEFEERMLNEFPAGGTGGGGGGWQYGLGGSTGAKGLNGYVYAYFNTVE